MSTAAPPAWLEAAAAVEAPPADRVPLAKPAPILKVSLTTPTEAEEPETDGIETDACRGGYAARTMLPSFAVCVLITAVCGLIDRAWDQLRRAEVMYGRGFIPNAEVEHVREQIDACRARLADHFADKKPAGLDEL